MARVFMNGRPNFPADQAKLNWRLSEIEKLIDKKDSNIEFVEAAFQLMEDCDLITEENIRFLCDARACKGENIWFIRDRIEGALRKVDDDNDVFFKGYPRFYKGDDRRVELNGQRYLISNDWYKNFSEDRDGEQKPSICPNKQAFYDWLKKVAQASCVKYWAENPAPPKINPAPASPKPSDMETLLRLLVTLDRKLDAINTRLDSIEETLREEVKNLRGEVDNVKNTVKALHEAWN